MKLSEAIRLGAMLKPQGNVRCITHKSTCAIGAALEAMGVTPYFIGYTEFILLWPFTGTVQSRCPACKESRIIKDIIWHLNDSHRWTRERIADWVATIEPQQEPAKEVPELAEVCK